MHLKGARLRLNKVENDIDLDDWMLEYAKNNDTYFMDQKKNYLHMRQELEKFLKKVVAA